jgi:hypothetical protein
MSENTVLKLAKLLYNEHYGLTNKTSTFKEINNDERRLWTQKAQRIIDMIDESIDSDE